MTPLDCMNIPYSGKYSPGRIFAKSNHLVLREIFARFIFAHVHRLGEITPVDSGEVLTLSALALAALKATTDKFSPVKFSTPRMTGEIDENLPLAKFSPYTVSWP